MVQEGFQKCDGWGNVPGWGWVQCKQRADCEEGVTVLPALRDLLGQEPQEKLEIRLCPDGSGQLYVPGLTEFQVQSVEDINKVWGCGGRGWGKAGETLPTAELPRRTEWGSDAGSARSPGLSEPVSSPGRGKGCRPRTGVLGDG